MKFQPSRVPQTAVEQGMQGGICTHVRPTVGLGTCPPLSRGVLTCPVAAHRPGGPTMRLGSWQLCYLHARPTLGLGTCPPLSRGALTGPVATHRLEGPTMRLSLWQLR